jgi:hypothetical protein
MMLQRIWGFLNNPSPPKSLLFVCLVGVYTLAAWHRLHILEITEVYSDTLSPFLSAMGAVKQGWADPPNPEADHWLWMTHVPLLMGRNLEEAFALRCLQAALIAPIGSLCAWKITQHSVFCTVIVGVILALDPGLQDTLITGFRGYSAPEWLGLSLLGIVFWLEGRKWGIALSIVGWGIASGHHPLALGLLFSSLFALYLLKDEKGWFVFSLLCLVAVFVPRIMWTWVLLQCDAGGIQCLLDIASGSAQVEKSVFSLLGSAFFDRFHNEMSWFGFVGVCGAFFGIPSKLRWWFVLSILGLLSLGGAIQTFRPYHLRLLVVPMVVLGCSGWWMKNKKVGMVIGLCWLVSMKFASLEPLGQLNAIRDHDDLGLELSKENRPIWVFGAWEGDAPKYSPSGMVLSAYLRGWDTQNLACSPKGAAVLIEEGHSEGNVPWSLKRFYGPEAAMAYLDMAYSNGNYGGGYDAAIQLCESIELW